MGSLLGRCRLWLSEGGNSSQPDRSPDDNISSGDLVFIALLTMDPKAKGTADVFRAGRQIGPVDLTGEPLAADSLGMIYLAEQEEGPFGVLQVEGGFPKVVRYAVIKN